ncbi:hypothetical protein EGT74_05935 [Chitinophaga lutea]|uniref:Uncharacterized protein n=1 Tax=Chitinophaga lutea TaxID=2488634 RepID=A0A3N4PWB2_9BACT|nr:hypothetical protein [Chitinophaga lutea]RPE13073.1 hypothetical protein EGT74_05935 [Chitinophaga lutea]
MQIQLLGNTLLINGEAMQFPLHIEKLQHLLGNARHNEKKHNHIYTWDDLGILAYSKNGQAVEALTLDIKPGNYDFSPASPFNAQLLIEQTQYKDYYQQHIREAKKISKYDEGGTLIVHDFEVWFDIEGGDLTQVNISHYTPPPPKDTEKYRHRKVEGETIEFADFNFKLAVIQHLMYDKKLLQPAFDLYDFVNNHAEREIDIEDEGYEFIPEVTAWFEDLEIDKKYADEITEIVQEGGDEIYGQVLRFWDGEDSTFNITDFDDTRHFKNLRKMTLFHSENLPEIKAMLAKKGIDVDDI